MQNNFETVNVLGLDFIKATQTEFLEQLKRDSQTKANRFIVTANPEIVLAANPPDRRRSFRPLEKSRFWPRPR